MENSFSSKNLLFTSFSLSLKREGLVLPPPSGLMTSLVEESIRLGNGGEKANLCVWAENSKALSHSLTQKCSFYDLPDPDLRWPAHSLKIHADLLLIYRVVLTPSQSLAGSSSCWSGIVLALHVWTVYIANAAGNVLLVIYSGLCVKGAVRHPLIYPGLDLTLIH